VTENWTKRNKGGEDTEDVGNYSSIIDVPRPYNITALPPIRHNRIKTMKPIPGVSYLSTSGMYDELVGNRKNFGMGHHSRR
jgi:hypothetical protein